MTNKKFWLGMLVLTLVFGMTAIGCKEDIEADSALNGTWVNAVRNQTLVLDNGNFTVSEYGMLTAKGTYSTSNGKISSTTTHLHGNSLNFWFEAEIFPSDWLTKAQIRQTLIALAPEDEEDIDEELNEMFAPVKDASYSVSGSTLTVHWPDGPVLNGTIVYTKR